MKTSGYLIPIENTKETSLEKSFFTNAWESGTSDVDVLALHDSPDIDISTSAELKFRIAWRRMGLVVFKTVEVLISLSTDFAPIWLLLFHPKSAGIWG